MRAYHEKIIPRWLAASVDVPVRINCGGCQSMGPLSVHGNTLISYSTAIAVKHADTMGRTRLLITSRRYSLTTNNQIASLEYLASRQGILVFRVPGIERVADEKNILCYIHGAHDQILRAVNARVKPANRIHALEHAYLELRTARQYITTFGLEGTPLQQLYHTEEARLRGVLREYFTGPKGCVWVAWLSLSDTNMGNRLAAARAEWEV